MTVTFMESPDATQSAQFWTSITGSVTYDTTAAVKKSGLASWKCDAGAGNAAAYAQATIRGGTLFVSAYFCFSAWPTDITPIMGETAALSVRLTSDGRLRLYNNTQWDGTSSGQLALNTVYRISLGAAQNVNTSARIYVDGVQVVSVGGLTWAATSVSFGWLSAPGANAVLNFQHVYGVTRDDEITNSGQATPIKVMAADTDYLYTVVATATPTIRKYQKSTMLMVAESDLVGTWVYSFWLDDTYLYAGTANTIRRYLKSDLSYTNLSSPDGGVELDSLWGDGTHLFGATMFGYVIKKFLISDLSIVATSPAQAGQTVTVWGDSTHVYCVDQSAKTIKKYLKSDLSLVATSVATTYAGDNMWGDGTYLYVGAGLYIHKFLTSDLSLSASSDITGGSVYGITGDATHIYASRYSNSTVSKYLQSDLSFVASTATGTGATPYPVLVDSSNVYAASGLGEYRLVKYSKSFAYTISEPGDVRVTAKRPAAVNDNQYTTTGGTGAVNERPITEANYKAELGKTAYLQDYTLETAASGDVDISGAGIVVVGARAWMWWKTSATKYPGSQALVFNGGYAPVAENATASLAVLRWTSTSYPSNAAGIGQRSTGTADDTFLYECGALVAYKVLALARLPIPLRPRAPTGPHPAWYQ